MNTPPQAPQEDRSSATLGFLLILVATFWGMLFLFLPVLGTSHPYPIGNRTYMTILKLKGADDAIRSEYWNVRDFDRDPIYATNWAAELTADKGAILNSRKFNFLNARLVDGRPVDEWSRPMRALSTTNDKGHLVLEFYSVGADGVSASQGNDPDDINSWNEAHPWNKLYGAEFRRNQSVRFALGLSLWCFIFLAGVYFRFLHQNIRSKLARLG